MKHRHPQLIPIITAALVAIATTFGVIALSGPKGVPRVEGPTIDWAAKAQAALEAGGLPWAKARFEGGTLVVSGFAPDGVAAAAALSIARSAIASDPAATGVVLGYANQIEVRAP